VKTVTIRCDTNRKNVDLKTVTDDCKFNLAHLSADCRPRVTITASGSSTYEAGDVLTCAADGSSPPSFAWSGTNGGSTFSDSSSMVTLLEGEFCLICTATLNSDPDCSARAHLCNSAYSKYRKQHCTLCTCCHHFL